MNRTVSIHETFLEKGNKAAEPIAQQIIEDKKLLPQLYDDVNGSNKRVKNAAAKTLQILSKQNPKLLYPRFAFFVQLIHGDDTILKWIALDVVGNFAAVDVKNQINKKNLQTLYDLLSDESMVTAGHAVAALGAIAVHKSRYRQEITDHLLRIEKIKRNPECRNILIGHTILALTEYFGQLPAKKPVLAMAQRALKNSRPATRNKAEKFLQKFSDKA